jgi:hypothetical protein
MCCGKPRIEEKDEPWWATVRVNGVVVTFQSQASAEQFLEQDIDKLPVNMQPVYAALNFKREQAEG